MNYRRASAEDVDELSKMRWVFQTESAESDPVWTKEQFIQACADFYTSTIESPSWIFWVAEDEDKIVAQVSIHIINNIPSPHRFINKWGYLTNVYTAQAFRNQGIGRGGRTRDQQHAQNESQHDCTAHGQGVLLRRRSELCPDEAAAAR